MTAGKAQQLGPGIWADSHGDIHFSIPDLLKWFNWPNDAKHRQLAADVVRGVVREQFPGVQVTMIEDV